MKMFLVTDDVETRVGMRLAGVDGALVNDAKSAEAALEKVLADENTAVLLVTEKVKLMCPDTVERISKMSKPVLCEIPDSQNVGTNKGSLGDYIKNAVGISL